MYSFARFASLTVRFGELQCGVEGRLARIDHGFEPLYGFFGFTFEQRDTTEEVARVVRRGRQLHDSGKVGARLCELSLAILYVT